MIARPTIVRCLDVNGRWVKSNDGYASACECIGFAHDVME